ncbi:MAG TPA: glycosyltransferase [Candidatus Dormibacteraeota bacterium]|nr:glycosyltransferase [Candidatus Dormibacteraeota bacterium]
MNFTPIWVGDLELAAGGSLTGPLRGPQGYQEARLLVRLHGRPLGYMSAPIAGGNVDLSVAFELARKNFGGAIAGHLTADGLGEREGMAVATCPVASTPSTPMVSVIVCTRDRPERIGACLDGLSHLEYPNFEVVVVDNASVTEETAELVDSRRKTDDRIRYVREMKRGLSPARNRGVAEARGDVVAFTDDDVLVDRFWLKALVEGLNRDPRVICATGIVPSAELESFAQFCFDQRVTWGGNFNARLYGLEDNRHESALYPYSAGIFGTGANFAFKREPLIQMGGFDEALGAGSPSRGGEDLDIFVRALQSGGMIASAPDAVAWHVHRADMHELRRQMFQYGVALSAFATKHLLGRKTAIQVLRRVPRGVGHMIATWGKGDAAADQKRGMAVVEAVGMLIGPWAYWAARRRVARGKLLTS